MSDLEEIKRMNEHFKNMKQLEELLIYKWKRKINDLYFCGFWCGCNITLEKLYNYIYKKVNNSKESDKYLRLLEKNQELIMESTKFFNSYYNFLTKENQENLK